MSAKPVFSIIIPTFNGGRTIGELLEKIAGFQGNYTKEVIILDSQSSDNSLSTVQKYRSRLDIRSTTVKQSGFNHGGTRNLGVAMARGEYVCFFSQDAVPAGTHMLDYYLEDFRRGARVVAVYGKHLPRKDTPLIQQIEVLSRWERLDGYLQGKPVLIQGKLKDGEKYQPYDLYALSNTSSCYRKSYLAAHPFRITGYGEDLMAGRDIIEGGYLKIYDPRCAVYHSHSYNMRQYLHREEENQKLRIFGMGLKTRANIAGKVRIVMQMDKPLPVRLAYLTELLFYYFLKSIIFIRFSARRLAVK